MGGGRCQAQPSDRLCGSCHAAAPALRVVDNSLGWTEAHGTKFHHTAVAYVTECCGCGTVPNTPRKGS